jgi:hypothetical protein
MVQRVIKFYRNWNNKLGGTYFTTIRRNVDRNDKVGDIYNVLISNMQTCKAELVQIYPKDLFINEETEGNSNNPLMNLILRLDTGYTPEDAKSVLHRFKINLEEDDWVLLLFRKLKAEESEKHERSNSRY